MRRIKGDFFVYARVYVYVSGHVSMVTRARHRVYPHPAPNADNVLFVCSNERALHLDSIS